MTNQNKPETESDNCPYKQIARLEAVNADLLAAALEIDQMAGQLDPHCKSPVLITYDAIMALRAAIDKAESSQ